MGVMIESNLMEGRQDLPPSGPASLKYGQSVTDACISWQMTVPALDRLREGVRARRVLLARSVRNFEPLTCGMKLNGVNGTQQITEANGSTAH